MARIDWVGFYLDNWALWKARQQDGGLGFRSESSFLGDGGSGYREAIIPINDCDASRTDRAVESLRPGRPHLYDCLYAYYVDDLTILGCAMKLGKAESTIKAQLDAADHALSAWFFDNSASNRSCAT